MVLLRSKVTDRSIELVYQMDSFQMMSVQVQIPYIQSMTTQQSISFNVFIVDIFTYTKPEPLFNFQLAGYVVSGLIMALFTVNIVYGAGHYQAVLEMAQLFCMLNYLEIYYPWPLYQFYEGLQILMMAPLMPILTTYIYSFSPAKFINYTLDVDFLRNCLPLILLIGLPIGIFIGILLLYLHSQQGTPDVEASKVLRICRVLKKRLFWRYLNDYFFIGSVWIGVFSVATFRNSPSVSTIAPYALACASLLFIVSCVGFIFYIVLKNVKKKKRNLEEIEGLV